MSLDINDPLVFKAIKDLKEFLIEDDQSKILTPFFEEKYNCKVIASKDDPWGLTGHIEFNDEKYQTWFLMKFGRD